jgi:hypothetical protein
MIPIALDARLEPRLGIEEQHQPLADVFNCHAIARVVAMPIRIGIVDVHMQAVTALRDTHHDLGRLDRRFDAMIDGVLEQRLQQERREDRIRWCGIELPDDAQALAEPKLLQARVALE